MVYVLPLAQQILILPLERVALVTLSVSAVVLVRYHHNVLHVRMLL
jgi:hypothetical protein